MKEGITDHFISYIKPKKKVMWQASRIHGITAKDLADAPSFMMLWENVRDSLSNRVLIAHSCGTEKRFLRAFPGQKFEPWVDSLTLSKAVMPELPSHKLGSLLPFMSEEFSSHPILEGRQWHDALYDAAASFYFVHTLVAKLNLYQQPTSLLLNPNTQKYHSLRH